MRGMRRALGLTAHARRGSRRLSSATHPSASFSIAGEALPGKAIYLDSQVGVRARMRARDGAWARHALRGAHPRPE